jgi:hypothetical protein
MSWLDEAVSRRMLARRDAESTKNNIQPDTATLLLHQQQQVAAFDPLIQRLLHEYGEFAFAKSLLQKRFIIRLEPPGKNTEKSWNWHWHLYSLAKHNASIELQPRFSATGTIEGFTILKGSQRIEVAGHSEEALKEGLLNTIDI